MSITTTKKFTDPAYLPQFPGALGRSLFQGIIDELNSLFDSSKADKSQENWIAPTLLNGWVNTGSTFTTAGYYKDNFGTIHLKGTIQSGSTAADTILFVLPSGYTPPASSYCFFPVMSNNTIGIVLVDSTGNVKIRSGSNASFCLDGISFRTT